MSTKWLQYVRHVDVAAYVAAGWVVASDLDDTHHGYYSQLLVWEGEGDPPKPRKNLPEAAE